MKKNLILVAMSTIMLASCVQEESLENQEVLSSSPKEITFQTVVAKQKSRALINGSEYKPTDPSFGAWARYNPSSLTVGTMAFINNEKIEFIDDITDYWGIKDTAHVHYWPNTGSLTFYAYSPFYYQEDTFPDSPLVTDENEQAPKTGQQGISFPHYNVDAHQQTDLMVADVQKGQTANITANEGGNNSAYTGVPTIFRHKLAVILAFKLGTSEDYDGNYVPGQSQGTFNSGAEPGDMRFFIKEIKLLGVNQIGSYAGETYKVNNDKIADKWVVDVPQTAKEYTWYHNAVGTEFGYVGAKQLNISWTNDSTQTHVSPTLARDEGRYHLLVLPQEFEAGKQQLQVTYFIKTYKGTLGQTFADINAAEEAWEAGTPITKTVDLINVHPAGNKAWKMNQKITYTLKFSTDEIRWAPQVTDWTATDYIVDL